MVEVDGAPAIRISGEIWGGISTTGEYQDYHLMLEFKWGDRRWPPRDNAKRDSGVLYHAVGPHGADGTFSKEEEMPTDTCQYFYQCENCEKILKPREGDCCVFCSFGTAPCPPMQ